MGLIIHTIFRGTPTIFPMILQNKIPKRYRRFLWMAICVGNLSAKVSFWADLLKANKLCLKKNAPFVFKKRGFSSIPTSHF